MIQPDQIYDNIFYFVKEAADLPLMFHQLKQDQQNFLRDFCQDIEYHNIEKQKETLQDLNLIKADLEALIADIEK